ncbi:ABC transporter permease [Chlorogloea sp. CCALA 695]|uniref:ABC transporter permease n=1 Tax=Chlorogloea sp. CCALA 695 TaxID=2107693 RepID=UPI000D079565|nr:ABC transporter permease [Chlorogloea sp. CCALA 695]PSB33533.1 ABC transporter permease [Chlorogloea sp. CCALA 695]
MLKLDWIEALGDRNPQLLRELKGRLKPRNLILAGAISILGQFLLLMSFLVRLPHPIVENNIEVLPTIDPYCTRSIAHDNDRTCLVDAAGDLLIDWQRWSLDLFLILSVIGIFSLLVAGTYLLIDNLAQEERRGTLNFIRLSPRSPQNILWGKILGVPILLYVVALLAVPLHLWAGFSASIPLIWILSFYGVLATSCLFFYSLSLLFSLISSGVLSGFEAWLGSGTVLIFLCFALRKRIESDPFDWLNVFSPALILQYLISATGNEPTISFSQLGIQNLHWFNLPVGLGIVGVVSISVLNYSLWTYWSWQAMQRRFPNFSKSIFSKRQSYLLVACFEVVTLGFAVFGEKSGLIYHFQILLAYNFLLFFGLIIALTPQRQAVQDWARYRKQKQSSRKGLLNSSLLRDLAIGEKSPAIVAIALNLAITAIILIPWIVIALDGSYKLSALMALVLSSSFILVCAAIAQLVVFTQTQKQGLWIMGILGTVIITPPLMLALLSIGPIKAPTLWLFTVFAVAAIKDAGAFNILLTLLGQLSILTLCSVQITRQLKKAGASGSISLFAPPKASLP